MYVLFGFGLLALIFAATRASAEETPRGQARRDPRTGVRWCELTAAQVAERSGEQLRVWLNCPGRLNSEVQRLVNILYSTDPQVAGAVLARWNARRNVERASPDGQLSASSRRAVDGAMRASERELRGASYAPTPLTGVERDAQGGQLARPRSRAQIQTVESISTAPVYYNPQLARQMAGPVARLIRSDGARYDRARVRAFQRAAGFTPVNQHGLYDCVTRNALAHFGIQSPPDALLGVSRNCASHPYRPPGSAART